MHQRRPNKSKRVLVLDYDQTVELDLDTGQPIDPFSISFGYRSAGGLFKNRLTPEAIHERMRDGYAHIRRKPQMYGWVRDGRIVASASDTFLRAGVVVSELLDEFELFPDPTERYQQIQRVYQAAYPAVRTQIRPEAPKILTELRHSFDVIKVVTNADPRHVRAKIENASTGLGRYTLTWALEHVHGFADKSRVTEHPTAIPETIEQPYLQRPVWSRRGQLINLLESFIGEDDDITFVGDNPDLDLHPGFARWPHAKRILVANADTPEYDRRYFRETPNCFLVEDLKPLPRILGV